MTRCEDFQEEGKCNHEHSSNLTNSTWCDIYFDKKCSKQRDMRPKNKCKFQKQLKNTPKQFQLEVNCSKDKLHKIFQRNIKAWIGF